MPRMALVVVVLNLLLCVILCDKKEFIINYEDYEEKIVVFVYHLNPFGNQKSSESRCKDNTYI